MKIVDFLNKNIDLRIGIIVIVIIISIYYLRRPQVNEKFDVTENNDIKPLVYDKNTGVITAGSAFVGLPEEIIPPWGSNTFINFKSSPENNGFVTIDGLDDGDNRSVIIGNNMCSKSCCSQQYPTPFQLDHDIKVCNSTDKFVPNSYKCNNTWQDSGCICLTQKQKEFLESRGGNA